MKNNIESGIQRIRISHGGPNLRSIGEKNGIHCLSEQIEEPLSELTPDDKQSYYVMLKRLGVPKNDAKKAVIRAENFCPGNTLTKADTKGHQLTSTEITQPERATTNTGIIKNIVVNFKDLIRYRKNERVPVREEIVLFEEKN